VSEAARRKDRREVTPFASTPISESLISIDMGIGRELGLVTPQISVLEVLATVGEINAIRTTQPDEGVGRITYMNPGVTPR
jgi:hypothetical protein